MTKHFLKIGDKALTEIECCSVNGGNPPQWDRGEIKSDRRTFLRHLPPEQADLSPLSIGGAWPRAFSAPSLNGPGSPQLHCGVAGYQWMMNAAFRRRYRFRWIGRSGEDVVGVVLDDMMLDTAAAFGMRFDITVAIDVFPRHSSLERTGLHDKKSASYADSRPGIVHPSFK
jgi:hypothetical protein